MEIKAFALKGKDGGKIVEVSQWCNDWFMLGNGRIVSPTALAFTPLTMSFISKHLGNGTLFREYQITDAPKRAKEYSITFKRRHYEHSG